MAKARPGETILEVGKNQYSIRARSKGQSAYTPYVIKNVGQVQALNCQSFDYATPSGAINAAYQEIVSDKEFYS